MSAIKALLLTDVVDSTRLAEKLGDSAMAEIWAAHDRVSRALLGPWRGREIDKTDGMLLLFDNAADAVAYAMEYHRALATLPTPLDGARRLARRAGDPARERGRRHRARREAARGRRPGQADRRQGDGTGARRPDAALGRRPRRRSARARTSWSRTATGGSRACPIRSSCSRSAEPDAQFVPPADGEKAHRVVWMGDWWLPVNEIPNNLPYQATSFIGRERELAEVKSLLGSSRLLTLLGMGGLGKTRLSLQIAARADPRLSRRRLVPRPGADQRPGADRQRDGAGARRARRARSAVAADRVRAPARTVAPC